MLMRIAVWGLSTMLSGISMRQLKNAGRQSGINPDHAVAHIGLASAYYAQGKLDEVVKECREALRINPNRAVTHIALGNAFMAQGKLDEAVKEYQEAIRISPNYADAHCSLGAAYVCSNETR